jgi:hypothetical protein
MSPCIPHIAHLVGGPASQVPSVPASMLLPFRPFPSAAASPPPPGTQSVSSPSSPPNARLSPRGVPSPSPDLQPSALLAFIGAFLEIAL